MSFYHILYRLALQETLLIPKLFYNVAYIDVYRKPSGYNKDNGSAKLYNVFGTK
jgi:hypothetical protein